MSEHNYYELLGLTDSADGTAVNRTYWQLARKYQALAPSDPRAHQMLDDLNEAYNTLGTPSLREAYDRALASAPPAEQAPPASVPSRGRARKTSTTAVAAPAASERGRRMNWQGFGGGLFGRLLRRQPSTASSDQVMPTTTSASSSRAASMPLKRSEAEELRASTASMVGRWRTTAAIDSAQASEADRRPDSTLVDICRSEHDLESQSEPLSAVLDVLRGSRPAVELK